jgi:hypothetical protein
MRWVTGGFSGELAKILGYCPPDDFDQGWVFDIRCGSGLRSEVRKVFRPNFLYMGDRLDVKSPAGVKGCKWHDEWPKLLKRYEQLGKRKF